MSVRRKPLNVSEPLLVVLKRYLVKLWALKSSRQNTVLKICLVSVGHSEQHVLLCFLVKD